MDKRFERRDTFRLKFSVPVEERIRHYFILNYGPAEIAQFLRNEFRELELTEFNRDNVDRWIKRNMSELSKAAESYRLELRDKLDRERKENFTDSALFETRIVRTYVSQGHKILDALEGLDITQKDEDGNYIHRGQFITLMMIIKENQSMVEKLSQTAAAREYYGFIKKLQAKAQVAKESGVINAEEAEVMFMDDENDFIKLPDAKPKK
jgi:hypothetical protein